LFGRLRPHFSPGGKNFSTFFPQSVRFPTDTPIPIPRAGLIENPFHEYTLRVSPPTPTARVVIVEYDGADVLPRCLASLAETVRPDVLITVLDNASPAPAKDLIPDAIRDRIEIERLEENVGYAGAIARAWDIGNERYLVIANNDLEFTDGWLDALVEAAERSGAHAVSAVIEHENASELERSSNASLNPLLYLIPGVFSDRTRAVYPSGACFLLRRDPAFDRTSKLRLEAPPRFSSPPPVYPPFFLYYEDVYIGFVLRALGKTVVQCPQARARHIGGHSVRRSNLNRIAFLQERNRLFCQLVFFDLPTLLAFSPIIFFDSLLKIPSCWVRRKPVLATCWAHIWMILNMCEVLRVRSDLRRLPDFDPRRILPYLTGKVLPPSAPLAGPINILSTAWCRLVGMPIEREARG